MDLLNSVAKTRSRHAVTAAVLLILAATDVRLQAAEVEFDVREKIVYSKAGERELLLDAFLPKGDEVRPAILVVHGGAWRKGNRTQLRGYATELTKMGFACFAIDYRLAPDHKFPAQIEDCRAAVTWIRTHAGEYKLDGNRLGAIGYSAGGHLVSLLATTGEAPSKENGNQDTRLQAVVAGGAPTDFRWFPDNGRWANFWMGGDLDTVPEKFLNASAAAFVDKGDPPIFFFNGDKDTLVPLAWTRSCFDALKMHGVKTEMHIIHGAGHMQAAVDKQALKKAAEFLAAELLPQRQSSEAAAEFVE